MTVGLQAGAKWLPGGERAKGRGWGAGGCRESALLPWKHTSSRCIH